MTTVFGSQRQAPQQARPEELAVDVQTPERATTQSEVLNPAGKGSPGFAPSKLLKPLLIVSGATIGIVVAGLFWHHITTFQETDDAYVTGHIAPVSSRIEANVEQVLIDDNDHVKSGQLVVVLDPRDAQRKVDEARAQLARVEDEARVSKANVTLAIERAQASAMNASGDVSSTQSNIAKAEASIEEARFALDEQKQILHQRESELTRADADYKRYFTLEIQGAVTTSQRDAALRDAEVAKASCEASRQAIQAKEALVRESVHQLSIARAQNVQSHGNEHTAQASEIQTFVNRLQTNVSTSAIKEAQAKLNTALLNLSYTRIYAPVSGRVGRKTVEVGQRLQPGGRLFTLTQDDLWIVANFKENQLEKMRVGQPVEIKIDSLPHEKLAGTVDSFSPGSGAQFTLLPPDNATGNFTKIVQRVPVKIRFTQDVKSIADKLLPGLSAVATVKVGQ